MLLGHARFAALSVFVAALGLLAVPLWAQELPRSPDGARGLGATTELQDLLKIFRQPSTEDAAFLRALRDLPARVRVLEEGALALARSRGWFELLPPRSAQDSPALHRALRAFLADPEERLAKRNRASTLWAEVFLDARFRARLELLEDWHTDEQDLVRGLALLSATGNGHARLDAAEASNVAGRVDLASALLRALLKDLEALRESPGSKSDVDADDVEGLLALADRPAGAERAGVLVGAMQRASVAVERVRAVLFTTRLRAEAQALLVWRHEQDARAETLRREAREWQPQTPEGEEAGSKITRQKKTTRRREAFARASASLLFDPLDPEMSYAAGLMARYVSGTLEALSYYDRFLALVGIRVHDDRTYRQRELSDAEKDALFFIQQYEFGGGEGDPDDEGE